MNSQQSDFDRKKIVAYWVETSEEDYNTMSHLYKLKKYEWALFLGHISLEKLLKGLYVQTHKEHAPFTHNLYRLGELIGLEISDEYADWLDVITSFNLNARYDDYEREFAKQCTPAFAKLWIDRIMVLRKWIKNKL